MGDPHESTVPAARLCPAVAALREDARARGVAALPPARLERRVHHARDGVRAVVVPRQHRGRPDRRGDGAYAVPRQGPHRLSRGHRRRVERGRLRQRSGRHHHHHGVDPLDVFEAYVAASVALVVCGIPAAMQQQRHSPILHHEHENIHVDWIRLGIVFFILITAIVTNVVMNVKFPEISDHFPFIGASVVIALLLTVPLRRPDWEVLPESFKGSIFLLSLVLSATMMPVEKLPAASWHTAMGLGFVSAVFDNIPLTALALKQGGYDWGYLAYGVGFGGSMIWFGSSAGVALSNMFPEAKSVGRWLVHGWHVTLAYVIGFFVLLVVMGWHPNAPHKGGSRATAPSVERTAVVPVCGVSPCGRTRRQA